MAAWPSSLSSLAARRPVNGTGPIAPAPVPVPGELPGLTPMLGTLAPPKKKPAAPTMIPTLGSPLTTRY